MVITCWWKRIASVSVLCLPLATQAASADDVKSLTEAGKAAEAYALGKKHPELLGQPGFDLFFGAAAIQAGHVAEGVLALERYLLAAPNDGTARLLLARGYFLLGEDARARTEFDDIAKSSPPPEVAVAVDRYLDAIRTRASRNTPTTSAFVELGVGRDSNVNAGPAQANVFIPGFGVQPLAESSMRTASGFASAAAGVAYNHPIAPGVLLFVQGQGERRFHNDGDTHQFEVGNYNIAGGVSLLHDQGVLRAGLGYGLVTVGSRNFRRANSVSVEWQQRIDDTQSLTLGGQYARFNYGTTESIADGISTLVDNSARDADFTGISAVYKRTWATAWSPLLTLALNMGDQRSRTGHDELVPRTLGASASLNLSPLPKWGVLVGYSYQQSKYHGEDFFTSPDSRRDRFHAIDLGLTYLWSRHLSFRAEAQLSRNRSNADVYAFPRNVFALKARYEFK
ncbi:hypothetical protein [Ramlibacter algicola]|uniref:DUF560 domain-containing protein n=1 Tax=Ramlibacter algicola TaxID=2795217 RepID=A0A934PWW0_9BURK|nr:hypothetical protein [Ramlibacter algicola]MBK0391985.1 hypothetical protein [Ramlibacter algicola]